MVTLFHPYFSGTYSPGKLRPDLTHALAERVRNGLFPRAGERRNRYIVVEEAEDRVRFRSEGLLTSIAIGWNDVNVQINLTPDSPATPAKIEYRVSFRRWARYCVALGGAIAVCLIAGEALFQSRLRTSPGYVKTIFWIMVGFWGFIWPWILVALHKRSAAKALERVFADVNET